MIRRKKPPPPPKPNVHVTCSECARSFYTKESTMTGALDLEFWCHHHAGFGHRSLSYLEAAHLLDRGHPGPVCPDTLEEWDL